jgi:hypothetical protein
VGRDLFGRKATRLLAELSVFVGLVEWRCERHRDYLLRTPTGVVLSFIRRGAGPQPPHLPRWVRRSYRRRP